MASLNKWMGIGNLGRDPEVKYLQSGTTVATFSMACQEKWSDKSGEKKERVEWVNCVAYGRLAEICGEYLAKGSSVYVEGALRTREWKDKDENKRKVTEVIARSIQMLGGGKKKEASDQDKEFDGTSVDDDSVPF